MSLFNEKLANIPLKEVLILIIVLFLIQYFLNALNIVHIDSVALYILIIFYFIFKLRNNLPDKKELIEVFSPNLFKYVLLIVILNIFISYGFLYLSDVILNSFPSFNFISGFGVSNSILGLGLISTIVVSPISEELIFRGVFVNRLQLIVPTVFAILISSLFFASLHSYGSITSAFIFAVCMAILYIKTENIFVAIFAHFLNNLFAEMIVLIDHNHVLFNNGQVVMVVSLLAIISFVIILRSIIRELNSIK